jgi:arylsulfatase A-like enzyme
MTRSTTALLLVTLASCGGSNEPPATPFHLLGAPAVVFAPEGAEELSSPISLGGERRGALSAATPFEFRYRVVMPERAFLTFAIGIAALPSFEGDFDLPGNRMKFTVRVGENAPEQTVFDREIHVSRKDRWLEQVVDLRRYAGREMWVVFQTEFPGHAPDGSHLPLVGVYADPVLHDRGAYRSSRGVVVVSIDTLRRDHVSLYGYPRRTTPGLELLARESVVFDDAVSTSSWTLPAHASLLTSTYPGVHGAVSSRVGLSPSFPNLARTLSENGFFTQAMVTHVYLSKEYGFAEGFDRHRYLPDTRAEELTNEAIRFLEARGDEDFFLFLHYYDPHWHYDPPPPYDTFFDPSYDGGANGIWWDFKDEDRESIDPRDLHHILALYDGEILYTDREVERLFREMKRIGVFEETLVVVTSDHGEEFLEHGAWEHQKTLYEEQLRIPLVMKLPRGRMGPLRVDHQVSLIDVAPTILAELGIEAPETYQGRPLLSSAGVVESAWAETEHTLDGSRKIAVRRGARERKSIFTLRQNGGELAGIDLELFDLELDSGETTNLDDPQVREAVEDELASYLKEVERRRAGKPPGPDVDLSPEEVERLRALGYLK